MNEHERGFLQFLAMPSRRRAETLLELGAKRRRDLVSLLHNAVRLDPEFSLPLTGISASPDAVETALRARGAPGTCYVLSAGDLDGREVPLREALRAISGMGNGAFISSVPGRLGYFQYSGLNSAYLLSR